VAAQHSAAPIRSLGGKSMGPGWNFCSDCRQKLTVRVGTLYERSHIPLHKWLMATHLVVSSKKGMSAMQLGRMLGITYKSARFMCHCRRASFAASLSNTEAADARPQLFLHNSLAPICQQRNILHRSGKQREKPSRYHRPKHALGGNCGAQGPITTPPDGFAV
jgi:transposase-like protein